MYMLCTVWWWLKCQNKARILLFKEWGYEDAWCRLKWLRGISTTGNNATEEQTDTLHFIHLFLLALTDAHVCQTSLALERGGRCLADTKNPWSPEMVIIIISNRSHWVNVLATCARYNHFMKISYSLFANLFNCSRELHPTAASTVTNRVNKTWNDTKTLVTRLFIGIFTLPWMYTWVWM